MCTSCGAVGCAALVSANAPSYKDKDTGVCGSDRATADGPEWLNADCNEALSYAKEETKAATQRVRQYSTNVPGRLGNQQRLEQERAGRELQQREREETGLDSFDLNQRRKILREVKESVEKPSIGTSIGTDHDRKLLYNMVKSHATALKQHQKVCSSSTCMLMSIDDNAKSFAAALARACCARIQGLSSEVCINAVGRAVLGSVDSATLTRISHLPVGYLMSQGNYPCAVGSEQSVGLSAEAVANETQRQLTLKKETSSVPYQYRTQPAEIDLSSDGSSPSFRRRRGPLSARSATSTGDCTEAQSNPEVVERIDNLAMLNDVKQFVSREEIERFLVSICANLNVSISRSMRHVLENLKKPLWMANMRAVLPEEVVVPLQKGPQTKKTPVVAVLALALLADEMRLAHESKLAIDPTNPFGLEGSSAASAVSSTACSGVSSTSSLTDLDDSKQEVEINGSPKKKARSITSPVNGHSPLANTEQVDLSFIYQLIRSRALNVSMFNELLVALRDR